MSDVTLHLGDCLDFMRGLPDASVDAVITDPPYGVKKADWDEVFPTEWIMDAKRLSKRQLVMPGLTNLITAGQLLDYKDCICLYAVNGMTRSPIAFGNWIPVLACGEWKWKARKSVIPFTVSTKEKIDHPSPKPLSAMVKLIEKYTDEGDTILDPFMGSGTTGVACVKTGRNFIGCEINADYYAIAQKRIAEAQLQYRMELAAA